MTTGIAEAEEIAMDASGSFHPISRDHHDVNGINLSDGHNPASHHGERRPERPAAEDIDQLSVCYS